MWFNPSELSKATPPANFANPANYEPEISKEDTLISKLAELAELQEQKSIIVTCYTPLGNVIEVEAADAIREAYLLKMNPKPTQEISQ
jgi:hypothetical protein